MKEQAVTINSSTQLKFTTQIRLHPTLSQVKISNLLIEPLLTDHSITIEQDRFDKDFAVADQKVRQQKFQQVQQKHDARREDRFNREI